MNRSKETGYLNVQEMQVGEKFNPQLTWITAQDSLTLRHPYTLQMLEENGFNRDSFGKHIDTIYSHLVHTINYLVRSDNKFLVSELILEYIVDPSGIFEHLPDDEVGRQIFVVMQDAFAIDSVSPEITIPENSSIETVEQFNELKRLAFERLLGLRDILVKPVDGVKPNISVNVDNIVRTVLSKDIINIDGLYIRPDADKLVLEVLFDREKQYQTPEEQIAALKEVVSKVYVFYDPEEIRNDHDRDLDKPRAFKPFLLERLLSMRAILKNHLQSGQVDWDDLATSIRDIILEYYPAKQVFLRRAIGMYIEAGKELFLTPEGLVALEEYRIQICKHITEQIYPEYGEDTAEPITASHLPPTSS